MNYNGNSVNLTFGFQILGVKAFNQNQVLVYGSYGLVPAILYSANGGSSFTLVYHSQYDQFQLSTGITDMLFPADNNTGYAIDADRILKTVNGGLNWTVVRVDPGSFFDHLEGSDNNNLVAMSTAYTTNKLLKTANAGISWSPLPLPVLPLGKIKYAYFLNANTGWINMYDDDNRYYFYKTINGGTTWSLQNNPEATPVLCSKIKFLDDNTGYALTGQNQVSKTTNSGILWQPLPRNNNYYYLGYSHNDLQCLNFTQLWAGGGHGFLEMSTNGGGTPLPVSHFRVDTAGVNISNTVNLINYSNPAFQFKWYVNNVLIGTSYNSSYIHSLSSQVDSIRLLTTSGNITETLTRDQYFTVPNLPVISSVSPLTGSTGTLVNIHGTGFTNVTLVKFGGVPAASFNIIADTVIRAVVAGGATGNVTVSDVHGTVSWPGFIYHAPGVAAPPSISSISPSSGPPGTTVTVNGNNFATAAANNIVYFGAVKANVVTASASQLVCIVPFGASYDALSILNKLTGLAVTTRKPFSVTFADSSDFNTHSFNEELELEPTIANPDYMMSKDMDGDGKPDIINSHWYSVSTVLRNTSTSDSFHFAAPVNIDLKGFNFGIEDMDGDGKPDVVGTSALDNGAASAVSVLRNSGSPGTIAFAPIVNLGQYVGNGHIALADIDNDGRVDILSGYTGGTSVSTFQVAVLRNTSVPGSISFAQATEYSTGNSIMGVTAGDLDGDGRKDIVAYMMVGSDLTTSGFCCFRNQSTVANISFAPKTDYVVPGYPAEGGTVVLADYDNDGKPDVILVNDDNCTVFRNTSTVGNISFANVFLLPVNGVGMGGAVSAILFYIQEHVISRYHCN